MGIHYTANRKNSNFILSSQAEALEVSHSESFMKSSSENS